MKRETIAILILLAIVIVAVVLIIRQQRHQRELQNRLAQVTTTSATPNADRIGSAVGSLASSILGIWVK